jgi:hypothetical protein
MKSLRSAVCVVSLVLAASSHAGTSKWDVRAGADYEFPASSHGPAPGTKLENPSDFFTAEIKFPVADPGDLAGIKSWVADLGTHYLQLCAFLEKQTTTIGGNKVIIPGVDTLVSYLKSTSGNMGLWSFSVVGSGPNTLLVVRLSVQITAAQAKPLHLKMHRGRKDPSGHPPTIQKSPELRDALQSIAKGIKPTDFPGGKEIVSKALDIN